MHMELENFRTHAKPARQTGFSMIEVLITVFVVAIGMLGIAALQFMSKRSNFEAVQRTTATLLANDIIERMRANPGQLPDYAGDASNPITPLGGPTATRVRGTDCSTTACTPFDLSQYDLWEWETELNGLSAQDDASGNATGGLVAPTACITTTVAAGMADSSGMYTVAIAWRGGTQMSNPVGPAGSPIAAAYQCGQGSGKYDSEDGTVPDAHRRILVVSTYISKS